MSLLATYHTSDGFRKVFHARVGESPSTVDLLDADGNVIVGQCPIIDDPETHGGDLPAGYATLDKSSEAPAAKSAKAAPPAAPAKAAKAAKKAPAKI